MKRSAHEIALRGRIADPVRAVCFMVILAIAFFSTGCISPHQATATDVDARSWHQPAVITFVNSDTTSLHNMDLFLRCNDRFEEDTMTVRIAVCTPDSLRHEESFTMVIASAHTPAALSREIDIPYRRRVRFDRAGDYSITITPVRAVKGIEAVGINLVKSE